MSEYVYIWRYEVRPELIDQFVEHYRPGGTWTRLFARADGYIDTQLLRARDEANVFITIDRWRDYEAFERFRQEYGSEFERIDQRCEELTEAETRIGMFEPV